MSSTVHTSHCKSALASADRWFPTQARSAKPATHTFLCGGIAVLQDDQQFVEMYAGVAKDVLENEGRVSICENFPRITGSWPSRYFPPPHLIRRAVRMLRFSEDTIPAYVLDPERCNEDRRINPTTNIDTWMLCAFAMDFDYKEIQGKNVGTDSAPSWLLDDIIADVRVIQRVILECGRTYKTKSQTDVATCVICIAYNNQKLGLHLYFPFTRYFPEECMHLAAICISRLQEERTVLAGCTRSWHEIVDLIYNASLRMPFVQKAKRCPTCENNPRKRRHCSNCQQHGVVWDDRRYYPVGMMDGNGEWMAGENSWIDPMVDFIRREPGISQRFRAEHLAAPLPVRCETAAATARAEAALDLGLVSANNNNNNSGSSSSSSSSNGSGSDGMVSREAQMAEMVEKMLGRQKRRPSVDKHKCAEYIVMFLCMCSLRINAKEGHTAFLPSKMMPRPNYPRTWVHYFLSVVHALQPPPTLNLSLDELTKRVAAVKLAASTAHEKQKQQQHRSSSLKLNITIALPRLQITGDALTPIHRQRTTRSQPQQPQPQPQPQQAQQNTNIAATGGTDADEMDDGGGGGGGGGLDGVEAEIDDIVRRLVVLRLQPTPWSNPGGSLGTDNHTVTKERESWEDRSLRSKFSHLFLTRMDDIEVVRKMATGLFGEFKEVETISNDPEGRCKRLQAHIREVGAPFYSKIQVIKIHISLKFKNSLVQVDGPGRHYCHIAGRNHRHNIITFQVKRLGQVLQQHCFHPKCLGRHHNMGAIQHYDIRVLFAPGEMLKSAEDKAPPEVIALAKNLQKTSIAHSTAVQKRTRRKTTVEHTSNSVDDNNNNNNNHHHMSSADDHIPSKFGPNAPPPLPLLQPIPNLIKLPPPPPPKLTASNNVKNGKEAKDDKEAKKTDEKDDGGLDEIEPPESPLDFDDIEEEDDESQDETDQKDEKVPHAQQPKPIKMTFEDAIVPPPTSTSPTVAADLAMSGRKKKKHAVSDAPALKKPRRNKPAATVAPVAPVATEAPLAPVAPVGELTPVELQVATTLHSILPVAQP